ncbi:hypothetical protein GCM10010298_36590 [Streptomyces microflavus]|nr:hypothetical protein GCM10010298_36590 [Streptomyces microflavus]
MVPDTLAPCHGHGGAVVRAEAVSRILRTPVRGAVRKMVRGPRRMEPRLIGHHIGQEEWPNADVQP